MTASRFFRLVWRVNGVLVLLLLLLGVALVLGEILSDLARETSGREAEEPALARTEEGERLELGDAEKVAGTPFVLLPLATRGERHGKFSSGGEPSVTRNLLFFDGTTGAARWLRPDHRGVVASRELIRAPAGPAAEEDGPVRFVRYELAIADTDGDGAVTGEDALDVAVSGPGGDGLATVLTAPDAILGYQEAPDGVLLIFHRRGADHLVARVDLAAREVVRTTKLPAP